jgi:NitT/TauT family transport system permease protein
MSTLTTLDAAIEATTSAVPAGRQAPAPPRRRPLALLRRIGTRSAAILIFLAVWEVAPRIGLVETTWLPPFSAVAQSLGKLLADGSLVEHIGISLQRSLIGFGVAIAIAVPLGLLIAWYRPVADFLDPLLEVFRNTAALALLPVFTLILGIGELSKVSLIAFACVWPILLNTISAVRDVDPLLVKSARSVGLSSPRLFQKVILPAAVPTIFTGIRLAGAASILVLLAAEMVGARAGLGYLINASQSSFLIPEMYAGIVAVSVIGVAFNLVLVRIERRLSRWRH